MADFRLGRLKFNWKGNWTTSTAFVIDDIVKYGANAYVCTTNHTSAANENLFYSSDLSNWSLHTEGVVSKGDWAATTWYKVNDVVKYGNSQYRVTTGHTSGATFSDTNFATYLEGLKFEDSWVASTTYQIGDIVTFRGYTYSSKTNHTGQTQTPNLDTTNWVVVTTGFSAQGDYATSTAYAPGDVVRYGGYSYVCTTSTTGNAPTSTAYWKLLVEGFKWTGAWSSATVYQKGDIVNRNSNTYICITSGTTGAAQAPELDTNGNYWNYIAQGGAAAQVLQETGDLLYQAAGGINRIALPAGSTGTAAQQAAASGQVLTVGGSPLLPRWESNNTTPSVYYVAETGSDTNNGLQISRAFRTVRYAMDYITGLTGSLKPTATNPISVYVKAGLYEESLPIHIPAFVSLIGDNIRNTIIKPIAGNSDQITITVSALTSFRRGDVVENDTGTKTLKVLDVNAAKTEVIGLMVSGGLWTTSDKYVDVLSNKHGDASDLLTSNAEFLAHEAYHRHVANNGAVSGTEANVKSRLQALVADFAYNMKSGGNNKVFDYGTAYVGGASITGNSGQDGVLVGYLDTVGAEVIQSNTVTKSAGNTKTQTMFGGTNDPSSPKCATQTAALNTFATIITTAITNGNMSHVTSTNGYKAISAVTNQINSEATMIYVATHNIVKDLVMEGMTGFVPSGSNDKDIEGSTTKGVYIRLDPASPITRSPYIQNCSAIGGAAVGALIDGDAHEHFNGSPTPSFKSICFDAYTQVLEGGVGFWCKGTAAAEVVSSFTYYAHISYISTGGARIRAVSGNSSYGKYGCLSRGFDAGETTVDGTVAGKMLTTDPQGSSSGSFQANERISGGTSNAIGELRSDQSVTSQKIYYIPIKGTFQQGELITGATSGATATLVNNSDAVRGQLGFLVVTEGLSAAPDQGGSVEYVDNGSNNDAGSYVISSSSYTAPDGRGNLVVTRGQLGSSAAAHNGTSTIAWWDNVGTTATIQANITQGASSPHDVTVDTVSGMVIGANVIIGNEMFEVVSFPTASSVRLNRAQEGTSAQGHTSGATITILQQKVASQDEVIADFDNSVGTIRVAAAGIGFAATDYIKIDNEFMKVTSAAADATGITILQFADEKTIGAGDGQSFKTRYKYSQVRLTAHDFLDVGTGNRAQTNWPFLPNQVNVPSQEIDEARPGRVYYVSTDQDGNFAVGKFFKVEQATGKATLDASAFDLTGLSSLRLGSIGAQLGASINEFSTDGTLSQNSDVKCPTQKAVKTYVDNISSVGGNLTVAGDLTVQGSTTTVDSVAVIAKDRNIELGSVDTGSFTGNITQGSNQITNINDTSNLAPGVVVALTGGGASVTLTGTVKVSTISGTTVTLDSSFGGSGSATGATFSAGGPTNDTAAGGGITLKGATDKTFAWNSSTNSWNSSEAINAAAGKSYMIGGTNVLTSTQVLGKTIGGTSSGDIVNLESAQTLTNKTLSGAVLTGSLTAGGGTGSSGQYLQSTSSGVQWATITIDPTKIVHGNSEVSIANNSDITFQTGGGNTATYNTSGNLTIPGTLTAGGLTVNTGFVRAQLKEKVSDTSNGISGNFNFDLGEYQVVHYRGDASSDFTINFRFDGSNSLGNNVSNNESVTATLITKNGGTARKLNDIQIDGNGITERYLGGFGSPEGTPNAYDVYTFTLIKDSGGTWHAYISYNYYTT